MRVLFTAWPGYGHLMPMLPLARAARDAGHDVVIATGPDLAGQMQLRGFATRPAGRPDAGRELRAVSGRASPAA